MKKCVLISLVLLATTQAYSIQLLSPSITAPKQPAAASITSNDIAPTPPISLSSLPKSTRLYKIQLIVFSRFSNKAFTQEHWPLLDTLNLNYTTAAKLFYPTTNATYQPINYADTVLPSSENLLASDVQHLENSSLYKVVMNVSWIQPLVANKNTSLYITGGHAYDSGGNVIESQDLTNRPPAQWEVSGLLTFKLTRFIETHFQLLFAVPKETLEQYAPNTEFINTNNDFGYFQLLQSRRMRSDQLNYIDYPIYGVLIKATRFKPALEQADNSTQTK